MSFNLPIAPLYPFGWQVEAWDDSMSRQCQTGNYWGPWETGRVFWSSCLHEESMGIFCLDVFGSLNWSLKGLVCLWKQQECFLSWCRLARIENMSLPLKDAKVRQWSRSFQSCNILVPFNLSFFLARHGPCLRFHCWAQPQPHDTVHEIIWQRMGHWTLKLRKHNVEIQQ